MRKLLGAGSFILLVTSVYAAAPTRPQILMDTTYRTPSGSTTPVNSGGNLQTAINNAACGDVLSLEAGATFTGNFTLPDKDCTDDTYVIIRTATPDGTFPRPGNRVGPGHASLMSKLTAATSPIVASASDADHYRFIGIEITPSTGLSGPAIDLSAGQGNLATETNHIIFDRCYIHGHTTGGGLRGISAQGSYIAVIDSYLSDWKLVGQEAQAFAAWNGSGPFKLVNDYIEGAGENVMFGGANSDSTAFIPSDIEVRRNHFFKPFTWYAAHPSYGGTAYTVKNTFELKDARRVLIEDNYFQNCWANAQNGYMVLFTPRNDGITATWTVVEDVTFRGNVLKDSGGGLNIMGKDDLQTSDDLERVEVVNNLMINLDRDEFASGAVTAAWQLLARPAHQWDITIQHNTVAGDVLQSIMSLDGTQSGILGWTQRYNITVPPYLVADNGNGQYGSTALAWYGPDHVYTANVMVGDFSSYYTGDSGNFFPANTAAIGFVNYGAGDYRLDPSSSYDTVGDAGSDLGAWIPAGTAATSQLDWSVEVRNGYTGVAVTFGVPGLPYNQSCDVRVGSAVTTSASGPARRTVVVTGLTPASSYFVGIDCGTTWGGWLSWENFTAANVPGGTKTVTYQVGTPPSILTGAARVTVDCDDNPALSTPTSLQNTSCSSGCSVDHTLPRGIMYCRHRWQDASNNVLATSAVQPLSVQ